MKNLKTFSLLVLLSFFLFSCAKDDLLGDLDTFDQNEQEILKGVNPLESFSKDGSIIPPKAVLLLLENEYPKAEIKNIEYFQTPSPGVFYFSIELSNNLEIIILQNANLLTIATIESEIGKMELKARDLPWNILVTLDFIFQDETIEEITIIDKAILEIDFKGGKSIDISHSGKVLKQGIDDDGDDDNGNDSNEDDHGPNHDDNDNDEDEDDHGPGHDDNDNDEDEDDHAPGHDDNDNDDDEDDHGPGHDDNDNDEDEDDHGPGHDDNDNDEDEDDHGPGHDDNDNDEDEDGNDNDEDDNDNDEDEDGNDNDEDEDGNDNDEDEDGNDNDEDEDGNDNDDDEDGNDNDEDGSNDDNGVL